MGMAPRDVFEGCVGRQIHMTSLHQAGKFLLKQRRHKAIQTTAFNLKIFGLMSGFRRGDNEIFTLLGFYVAYVCMRFVGDFSEQTIGLIFNSQADLVCLKRR